MQPAHGGEARAIPELVAWMDAARTAHGLAGLTLTGGEPFAQARGATELAAATRAAGLSVIVFSGYTRAELVARADAEADVAALLASCDLLVDGRYERDRPERRRRWIGSTNQTLHCLTARYRADDPSFARPNTVELRLARGELSVNGWPGALELAGGARSAPR